MMKNTLKAMRNIAGNLNQACLQVKAPLLIIAIIAITGFSMTACDSDDDIGETDPLNGTWTAGNMEWTFKNGSYELKENGKLDEKGTFKTKASARNTSPSKGIMELTPTHINGENWYMSSPGDLEEKWYSKDDLKKKGIGDDKLGIIFEVDEKDYELDGNTLTLDGTDYTKKGVSGKLTVSGLPSGQYAVYVFNSGTDISTITAVTQAIGNQIASGQSSSGNVFTMYNYPAETPFTVTGSRQVVLQNTNGDINSTSNPMFRRGTVSFINGGATVSFSSFTAVTSDGGYVSGAWTAVADTTFGNSAGIYSVTWGNNMFVAGGQNGKMAYSTDGITWEAVANSPFDNRVDTVIYSIVWGNNMFVAGGTYGDMAVSTDGKNWTPVDSAFGRNTIDTIIWANDKFVAVGDNYNDLKVRAATSTNGTTWTPVTISAFDYGYISGIAWGSNKFVAAGSNIATSSDGAVWTPVETNAFSASNGYAINDIVFGNNLFVAGGRREAGNANSYNLATSTDGIVWTPVPKENHPFTAIDCITFGNNMFIAGGDDFMSSMMGTSTDGKTWTKIPSSATTFGGAARINDIAWGNNKFVAVGGNEFFGSKMAYWQP